MKFFFKPTKVTWIAFVLLIASSIFPFFLLFTLYLPNVTMPNILSLVLFLIPGIFLAGLHEYIYSHFVSYRTIAYWDLAFFVFFVGMYQYLLASMVSWIWYSVKNKVKSQKGKENIEF